MKCKNCGFENRASVQFCEECGQAMGKPSRGESSAKPGKTACPSCGYVNRPDVKFCEECGHAVGKPARGGPANKAAKATCPSCGHANRPGVQYCEECGAALHRSESPRLIGKAGRFLSKLNFKRVAIGLALITVLAVLLVAGLDRLQYPVTRADARSKADAVIQAYYPELADVSPQMDEYEGINGETLTSYSYTSVITAQGENGGEVQYTVGAVIVVDRKTGEVEVITIR